MCGDGGTLIVELSEHDARQLVNTILEVLEQAKEGGHLD
jgi:hypothetical protein